MLSSLNLWWQKILTNLSIFIENGVITRSTIEHIDHARHFVNFVQVMYRISGKANCQIFQCQHIALYSCLHKPCKETAKWIAHAHNINCLIVECMHESWAVNSENQHTNVYSNDIRWHMAWKRESLNHLDTILKPNTCAHYSVLCLHKSLYSTSSWSFMAWRNITFSRSLVNWLLLSLIQLKYPVGMRYTVTIVMI